MSGSLLRCIAFWAAIALVTSYGAPPKSHPSTYPSSAAQTEHHAPTESATAPQAKTEYVLNHDAAARYWAGRIAAGFPFDEMPKHSSPIDKKDEETVAETAAVESNANGAPAETIEPETEAPTTTSTVYDVPTEEAAELAHDDYKRVEDSYGAPVVESNPAVVEEKNSAPATTESVETEAPSSEETETTASYDATTVEVAAEHTAEETVTAEVYGAPSDVEQVTEEPASVSEATETAPVYAAPVEEEPSKDESTTVSTVTENIYGAPVEPETASTSEETEASVEEEPVSAYGAEVSEPEMDGSAAEDKSSGYVSSSEGSATEIEETTDAKIETVDEEHKDSAYVVGSESSGSDVVGEAEPQVSYHAAAYTDMKPQYQLVHEEPSTDATTVTTTTTTTKPYKKPVVAVAKYWKKIRATTTTTTTTTTAAPISEEKVIVEEPAHVEPATESYYTAAKIAEDGASRYWKKLQASTQAATTTTEATTTTVAPASGPVEAVKETISYIAESLPSFSDAVDGVYGAVEQLEQDAEDILVGKAEPSTTTVAPAATRPAYILNADAAAAFWATASFPSSTAAPAKDESSGPYEGEKIPTIVVADDSTKHAFVAPPKHAAPVKAVYHPKKLSLTHAKMNGY